MAQGAAETPQKEPHNNNTTTTLATQSALKYEKVQLKGSSNRVMLKVLLFREKKFHYYYIRFFFIFRVLYSNRLYDPDVLYRVLLYSYFCVRHRFSSNVLFSFPSAFVMWPEHIRLLTSLEDKVARQKNQKLFYCRKVQHYFPLYGSQSSKCVCPFQQYFSSQGLLHTMAK